MAAATAQGADRTALAEILKQNYSDGLVDQMVRKNWIATQLMKKAKIVGLNEGREYVVPLWEQGSSSGLFRSEWGVNPTAFSQKVALAKFNMATYLRTIQLSGQIMHGSAGNEAAVVRALDFEVRGAMKDAKDNFATSLWTPASGVLAQVKSEAAGVVTLNGPSSGTSHAKWLRVGDRVSALLTTGVGTVTGFEHKQITAVNTNADDHTFTIADSGINGTLGTGNFIFKSGTSTASSGAFPVGTQNDDNPFGITDIISTANAKAADNADAGPSDGRGLYGQIDRTTSAFWQAQETNAADQPVSHEHMADMRERIETDSSGFPKWAVTTYKIWKDIVLLHSPMKVYDGNAIRANAWFEFVMLESVQVYRDRQCPPGDIFVFDDDFWEIAENRPIAWVVDDGDMLSKVPNKWGFDGLLARMHEVVCSAPNAQGRIKSVAEAAFTS